MPTATYSLEPMRLFQRLITDPTVIAVKIRQSWVGYGQEHGLVPVFAGASDRYCGDYLWRIILK